MRMIQECGRPSSGTISSDEDVTLPSDEEFRDHFERVLNPP